MTIIQAQLIGDRAILPRTQLEQLLELARRSEPVSLQLSNDDLPTVDVMRLAESGGAFEFWHDTGEDIYSATDGEPVQ
jgi:hypothetical protein